MAAPAGRVRAASRPVLRERLAAIARGGGMQLCGAGCMGFVNVARGLRAIGYVEPDQLPAGPVALVTHSGSVFSAMLRSGRAIGFTLAVSSGQELVTPAAAYLEYTLALPETRVLALVLEAMREPGRRLGGAGGCLWPAPGRRPGRAGGHAGAVRDRPPRPAPPRQPGTRPLSP